MARRRLVVTPATAALLLVAGSAWAGPPPPPPSGGDDVESRSSSGLGGRIESEPSDPLAIDQRTPDTDLRSNWTFSRGGNQGPNYVRAADDDPFFTVNPIGYYQGVSVGGGNLPPFAPTEIGGQSAVLTWTGFERREASSRVFFQLSTTVEPEITSEGLVVKVKLPRTSVTVRNNRRKLITKFFKTPVNEVKISKSGKDIVAILDLRWEATPQWSFEDGGNGYRVLVLEFSDIDQGGSGGSGGSGDSAAPPPPAPPPPVPPSSDEGDSDAPFLPSE